MNLTDKELWRRFQKHYADFPQLGLSVDISRMNFSSNFFRAMRPKFRRAFRSMANLERGAVANPDERRMVGHYWLRTPELAPNATIRRGIDSTVRAVKFFARQVHTGRVRGANGRFANLLVIGIGGSALGPQFVASALGHPLRDRMNVRFFDNTDPDGMDKVLTALDQQLGVTLCVVISKSGGTKETRNGMLEARSAYERAGLKFARHAVAVTGVGSELDKVAVNEHWLERFPMWDWVGGRTSEMSAVGLLPAALQGIDIARMLAGARACDAVTREPTLQRNPAALLAAMWYHSGNGKGLKDMVVIAYKDRLELFSRYLQQLVMESLGKEKDLKNKVVNQGIAVYGNKGSTDQHAYVQQLREGLNNFFVTFIEVLKDRNGPSIEVEEGVTSGDYLQGFLLGTRQALYEKGRESITLTVKEISSFSVGVLISLFERAVGLYASLIGINAYHQPGVEAGKRAAGAVIVTQGKLVTWLKAHPRTRATAAELAAAIGEPAQAEVVFKICERLAVNVGRGMMKQRGKTPFEARYRYAT